MSVLLWLAVFGALLWAFILLIDRFYDLEAHGISLGPGTLMWRTKHGLGVLNRISNAWKGGWKVFGVLGAVTGAVFMVLIFVLLILNTVLLFTVGAPPGTGGAGIKLALPGITIPFLAGIIGIATVLIVHEPAHGIVLRRLNLQTKSTGLALFLVIPGAFVEEDEDEFKNASVSKRLQVAGAGSFANILFGILCFGLVLALVTPLSGVFFGVIAENTPAAKAELKPGMRLTAMENTQIRSYEDFDRFMSGTRPGENIVLHTEENQYVITLDEHPSENIGYLGVALVQSVPKSRLVHPLSVFTVATFEILGHPIINQYAYETPTPWFLIEALKWMFTLNLLVGLFNLLPLSPLDGGHIVEGLAEKVTSKTTAKTVTKGLSITTLTIILLNFAPMFM